MPPSHTPVDQEWFKEFLEEKFRHFETKIEDIDEKTDRILVQTTKTNGRVDKLEDWKHNMQGTFAGINKTSIVSATVFGFILNMVWDWFKTTKLGQ